MARSITFHASVENFRLRDASQAELQVAGRVPGTRRLIEPDEAPRDQVLALHRSDVILTRVAVHDMLNQPAVLLHELFGLCL
jgi:hypothetical protein